MPKKSRRRPRPIKKIAIALLLIVLFIAAAIAWTLESMALPPRQFGPHIESRLAGNGFTQLGAWFARTFSSLDRSEPLAGLPALRVGAQAATVGPAPAGNVVPVDNADAAIKAIEKAQPGDVITFAPGTYHFNGRPYLATSSASGVTVRAGLPGSVMLAFGLPGGFLVASPNWTFENLQIRGACTTHDGCDHAFHVIGNGSGFVARNNTVTDFNMPFKIGGNGSAYPDNGVIEHNTISNRSARDTVRSVGAIDVVAASNWTIRANLVSDFAKAKGDLASFGVQARGGGKGNRIERNVLVCENRLRGAPGQRIGLSLGGAGSIAAHCRGKRCVPEQDGGVIDSNLVASCSDEGLHLNRAAATTITHNTLLDTAGMAVQWAESAADIHGNIVDGRIVAKDGATVREDDNLDTGVTRLFMGAHPLRELFAASASLDLHWRGEAPRRDALPAAGADLCGTARPAEPAYGAFEDFAACLTN
ncbi:right-handed parallel beta-helix repeat-containing protein [Massilia sp. GCM10020059]|uniref:Right-handed parallel beta-helix repeat-containing protein n=1 Tax=Massilia agrisoli TaxID=2892444 RepID=A0ABS8ITN1_9BURK|nr:right-handed parallel beta-helix repeat-containing protein [Massilia agrisoli]MCC6071187.1 right-handed parallel beta-helix repeat-containing protein [Massilia agrisoli]